MARQDQKDFTLTVSGYEYDKELSRVPIKVFPALQALIANQHDLIEVCQKHAPEKLFFLENHMSELNIVEETIAKEHARYCAKKEELKRKRQEKGKSAGGPSQPAGTAELGQGFDEPLKDDESLLEELAAGLSPGLPSARLESSGKAPAPSRREEVDVRRIAIGASVKALSTLLGRQLTDREISVIEKQVDSYL
ncbi:MAG: hypothetical protein K6T65_11625 [Peptococcaceae bacterium]|nr:hypothetical protein [Peptococcaceae bacterium]